MKNIYNTKYGGYPRMKFYKQNLVKSLLFGLLTLNIMSCSNNKCLLKNNKHSMSNKKAAFVNKYTKQQDGHPHPLDIPDLSSISEPLPKYEPKSRYGNPREYKIFNKTYKVLNSSDGFKQRGYASWYGTKFHGFRTSSGEIYNMYAMTAAHKTLPLPTYAKITNLHNKRSIIVKINDRGPFHGDRIIDLSYVAASKLGIIGNGVGMVEVSVIKPGLHKNKVPKKDRIDFNAKDKFNIASTKSNLDVGADFNTNIKTNMQVGAFIQENNAKDLANQLEKILKNHQHNYKEHYKINIISEKNNLKKTSKDNTLYKVILSSVNGELDINKLKAILPKIPN